MNANEFQVRSLPAVEDRDRNGKVLDVPRGGWSGRLVEPIDCVCKQVILCAANKEVPPAAGFEWFIEYQPEFTFARDLGGELFN